MISPEQAERVLRDANLLLTAQDSCVHLIKDGPDAPEARVGSLNVSDDEMNLITAYFGDRKPLGVLGDEYFIRCAKVGDELVSVVQTPRGFYYRQAQEGGRIILIAASTKIVKTEVDDVVTVKTVIAEVLSSDLCGGKTIQQLSNKTLGALEVPPRSSI